MKIISRIFLIFVCSIIIFNLFGLYNADDRLNTVYPANYSDRIENISLDIEIIEDMNNQNLIFKYNMHILLTSLGTSPNCAMIKSIGFSSPSFRYLGIGKNMENDEFKCFNDKNVPTINAIEKNGRSYREKQFFYDSGEMTLQINSSSFYKYPFDDIIFYINVNQEIINKEGEIGLLPLRLSINSAGKNIILIKDNIYVIKNPNSKKILTIVLIFILLGCTLSIVLINDINTIYQCCIGLLFGIWTIKQAIIPSDIAIPLLMDIIFLFIYTIFGLLSVYQIYIVNSNNRFKKHLIEKTLLEKLLLDNKNLK